MHRSPPGAHPLEWRRNPSNPASTEWQPRFHAMADLTMGSASDFLQDRFNILLIASSSPKDKCPA